MSPAHVRAWIETLYEPLLKIKSTVARSRAGVD